jgi:hypothetical protein
MFGSLKRKIVNQIAGKNLADFKANFNSTFFETAYDNVPFNFVSFSGSKYFWDQVYTISSFCKNVGRPLSWTIYSDGSYSKEELDKLNRIEFINTRSINLEEGFVSKKFLVEYPLLKKLDCYSKHLITGITVFCDSDILFFPKFKSYLNSFYTKNWYLPDEGNIYFDPEYARDNTGLMYGVNTGFLIVNKSPKWQVALDYIKERIEHNLALGHWSEQTAIHKMITQEHTFLPLDPRVFILDGRDSFTIKSIPWNEIVMRHYVGPVRLKMWQLPWKKILQFS